MAQTFTIDSIAGNSYIGVPVFSRFGQMQNYNYIVMSPQKKMKQDVSVDNTMIDQENERYKLDIAESITPVQDTSNKGTASRNSAL